MGVTKDGITNVDMSGLDDENIPEYDNFIRRKCRGDMIKIIRLKKDISQKEMARKYFDCTEKHYNLFEKGRGDMTMAKLDEALYRLGFGVLSIVI